ncbi:CCA tRNA nucleotidyltransferase, mitochondrial [Rhododendron vialii]|uniref:CCA tRNA nucleotidyltransferase, mitochondrial n=1 Tax=Rhododendron vialii TaxID=182163 RepID=UPI00265F744B|nr:CCA tRNA nucleotidyltransferase, mitochondrial [Rhododendron vialii]
MRIVSSAHRFFSFQTPPPPSSLSSISKPSLLPTLRPIQFKNIINSTPLRFRFLARGFSHRLRAMSTTMTEDPASSAPSVQVRDRIDLTDKERLIFGRLLEVLRHFSLQTQLRVAGGWVRDKLLGRDCYDIDIAIDNMLGKEFCEKVNEYLLSKGEEAHGIGVIQCNPDQSKHLETARMRLFDVWIDVVNLRSEDYSENSRIPTMRFGTAEEDAYRRDLTINSLFYNINTSSVEDFTRRGIADLKSGKIVTPLPPKETFLDDPLRVLRAIRFGARFGFTLDGELKKAASDDDVKAAIADKISRERVGHEIDLMVSGSQPVKAISYVSDLLLFWVVFSLPPEVDPPTFQGCESLDRICVTHMDAAWNLMQLIGCSAFNDEQRRLSLYATLFLPLRSTTYIDNKSKKVPVVNYIFRNSLKLKASDAETVINVHNATEKLLSLIPLILSNPVDIKIAEVDWGRVTLDVPVASKLRILAGLLLREIKDFWRVALLASVLLYPTNIDDTKDSSAEQFQLEKRSQTYKIVENAITDLGLEKVWEMKRLVNGKDIMSILQLKAGGPLVREWQQKLLEWQLAHPSGTSEECLDWMRQTNSKRARVE